MAISCILDSMSNIFDLNYDKVIANYGFLLDTPNLKIAYDEVERVYFIRGNDQTAFDHLDLKIEDGASFDILDYDLKEHIKVRYDLTEDVPYRVYVYPDDKIEIEDHDFRILDLDFYDLIRDNYEYATDDELKHIFEKKEMYVLFVSGEIVGFIGVHRDGTMGLLHVFDNHRKRGYGLILEKCLIARLIAEGKIAYCNVVIDNEASKRIQKKLGLKYSDERYWLFK